MNKITHNLPWTESPFFEKELRDAGLSAEDEAFVRHFAEKGYAILDTGMDHAVLDRIVRELDKDFKTKAEQFKGNHHESHRIQDAWKYNELVKQVAVATPVMDKLQLLYRRRPIPFQTLNFDVGTQQRTHSDMIHFSSIPERFMCGVWVAFEDITEDNGPLHYYPGSHKLPFYEMSDMGVKASESKRKKNVYMDYSDYYENFIEEVVQNLGLKKEVLLIKKGQALIWAANLLHGGEPIRRPGASRHSQVSHYYFENCTYYTPLFTDFAIKEIFLRQIVDISTGEKVENKYLGEVVKKHNVTGKILEAVLKPFAFLNRK
ncbi:MAG TPA: phytanoyl-CoA dioxygenase family protein [Flavisolibacter sp.]|nr:phytanoyl-CoA dioxygenase family protein [Flavisolibacter sp.]